METTKLWIAGASSGIVWWLVSKALGAEAYGVLGKHEVTGFVAGTCTGCLMAAISAPVYRRLSNRSLIWYSALSVYVAVLLYGTIALIMRVILNDFHPDQGRWEVGMESVLGMWWGVSILLPIAIVVQLLAYANHRCLKWMCCGGGT